MTSDQRNKIMAKYRDYATAYPDAEFAPWDEPPTGRIQRIDSMRLTGRVVGIYLLEKAVGRQHLNCPSCSCVSDNPFFGWWEIESEQYKDDNGKPQVLIEYPPAWRSVKDKSQEPREERR